MTQIASPAQALAAWQLGYFNGLDLVRFVIEYLADNPTMREQTALAEIASINQKKPDDVFHAGAKLSEYLKAIDPNFDWKANISEQLAKALLKSRLEQYLRNECAPIAVCRMVTPIEQAFDFPAWLGNLYNECDWVDERHTREELTLHREAAELSQRL